MSDFVPIGERELIARSVWHGIGIFAGLIPELSGFISYL